jgi:hypothetical protein
MRSLGIFREGKIVKIAIISKVKNHLTLERLEEFSEISHELIKEKNLHIVSGLSSEDIVRREVMLQLTRESALLKALPFQLESLLPFSLEETIVHPFFFPQKDKTEVVVFATTRLALKKHLASLLEKGIDPDQTSSVPIALARWTRLMFPAEFFCRWIHGNTALAIEGDKIVFSQTLEDTSRLEAYLKSKFSHFFSIPSDGPSFQGFPYEKLREFAIPLGLALDGLHKTPCQFRQDSFSSTKTVKKKRFFTLGSLAVPLGLTLLVGTSGGLMLHQKETALQERISVHFASKDLSLEQTLDQWQKKLTQDGQEFPLLSDIPSVRDVLAWLGTLQEPVELIQFHYALVQYPQASENKAGKKQLPYSGKVDLEFKAASPAIAHHFQEAVEKVPTLVDKKQKVEWNAQQESYKISFVLRKT